MILWSFLFGADGDSNLSKCKAPVEPCSLRAGPQRHHNVIESLILCQKVRIRRGVVQVRKILPRGRSMSAPTIWTGTLRAGSQQHLLTIDSPILCCLRTAFCFPLSGADPPIITKPPISAAAKMSGFCILYVQMHCLHRNNFTNYITNLFEEGNSDHIVIHQK